MKKFLLIPTLLLFLVFAVSAQGSGSSSSLSKKNNNNSDIVLKTLGMSLGQGVYTTFASIGTIADAYAKGAYEDSFAQQLLKEYIQLSKVMSQQLSELSRSGKLNANDKAYVQDVINTYNYLSYEAQGYHDYIASESSQDLNTYNTNRDKAWQNISRLLDL